MFCTSVYSWPGRTPAHRGTSGSRECSTVQDQSCLLIRRCKFFNERIRRSRRLPCRGIDEAVHRMTVGKKFTRLFIVQLVLNADTCRWNFFHYDFHREEVVVPCRFL